MPLTWVRPNKAYPQVWSKFIAPDLDGTLIQYEIRDLTEEHFDAAVSLMKRDFVPDEPVGVALNVHREPESIVAYETLWRISMNQKMPVGCFKTDTEVLVGVNFLAVSSKNDPKSTEKVGGPGFHQFLRMYSFLLEAFNAYDKFGVDKYLGAYGMGVAREYRRRNIATEFLKARLPMMRELGIPCTSTMYTSPGTQKAAVKAGYELFYEISYEDCVTKLGLPLENIVGSKSNTVMGIGLE